MRWGIPDDIEVGTDELVAAVESEHVGEVRTVTGVNSLTNASESDLAFSVYDDPSRIDDTNANVVVCKPSISKVQGKTLIRHSEPRIAFVTMIRECFRSVDSDTFVHPSAVVEEDVQMGESCWIGANAYIGDTVVLGDACTVMPQSCLGTPAIGCWRGDDGKLLCHPNQGTLSIEDRVYIGAGCTLGSPIYNEATIGEGSLIGTEALVSHDVEIGNDVWINAQSYIGGNAVVEDRVDVHPCGKIAASVTVGKGAEIGIGSVVLDDVDPGVTVVGVPASPIS